MHETKMHRQIFWAAYREQVWAQESGTVNCVCVTVCSDPSREAAVVRGDPGLEEATIPSGKQGC